MSTYTERVAKGLCGKCGEKSAKDNSLCPTHQKYERDRAAAKRQQRKTERCCSDCGDKLRAKDEARCAICKDKRATHRREEIQQYKEQGLCSSCGNRPPKSDDHVLCQLCIDRLSQASSARYRDRKESGTCCYCHRKPAKGFTMCSYHRKHYKNAKLRVKLEVMEAYGGPQCKCGEDDITILEIDHIKGGGRKHFREENISGGSQFYSWLRRNGFPKGYRVLCPTCNKKAHVRSLAKS